MCVLVPPTGSALGALAEVTQYTARSCAWLAVTRSEASAQGGGALRYRRSKVTQHPLHFGISQAFAIDQSGYANRDRGVAAKIRGRDDPCYPTPASVTRTRS